MTSTTTRQPRQSTATAATVPPPLVRGPRSRLPWQRTTKGDGKPMQTAPPRHAKDPEQEAQAQAQLHNLATEARTLLIERDAIADLAITVGPDPMVVSWIGRAAYVLRAVADE